MSTTEGKFITFNLRGEEYGISIYAIKEINGMMNITAVPRTPEYVKGIINLRGKIVPVIDLRTRFGLETKAYDDKTCIVVVDRAGVTENCLTGLIVDTVAEVVDVKQDDVQPTPQYGAGADNKLFLGVAKVKDRVVILLDIDSVLKDEDELQITDLKGEGEECSAELS
jgi:purine-binding chemotaxis protein CheW